MINMTKINIALSIGILARRMVGTWPTHTGLFHHKATRRNSNQPLQKPLQERLLGTIAIASPVAGSLGQLRRSLLVIAGAMSIEPRNALRFDVGINIAKPTECRESIPQKNDEKCACFIVK